MEFRGVIFILFLFLLLGVDSNAFPMNDLISKLPGQPDVIFRQFAGYIEVDENVDGRSLFYYFVEDEKDPIWRLRPECSSVGDAFGSVGPFIVKKDAHGLQTNSFSWNKVSNLLFIDSPIGSGWSYSNSSSDYNNEDDSTRHFVPNLANALLDENKQSKFNLKGLVLDDIAKIDFFFSQEMINSSLYNEIKKECYAIDESNHVSSIKTTWSAKCKNLVFEADLVAFKTDALNYSPQKLFDVFLPHFQKSFHRNRTNLSYRCQGCFTANFKYNEDDKDLDMLPTPKNLPQQSVPITIFSGDQDGIIPTEGTLQHLEKLVEELNIKLAKEETWSFRTKEGGLKYEFGDLLKFLTVKGGNHHVTSSRPSQAISIF
ncbi:hypothetical protein V6Z11_A05G353400 [Gossypium hirsutum]